MNVPEKETAGLDQGKGEKRKSEDADEVHSANNWEEADLGDVDRRQKFLRLMGACKKEHHGRFVIGDNSTKHGRSDEETNLVNRQLENQYRSGLDLKLSGGARHHTGLGFHGDSEVEQPTSSSATSKELGLSADKLTAEQDVVRKTPPGDVSKETPSDCKDKDSEKKQTNGKEKDTTREGHKPSILLNFVKSSS